MSKMPKALAKANYHDTIPCKWCKHVRSQELPCGSQSFMTVLVCKKAKEQVAATGTCDKAER